MITPHPSRHADLQARRSSSRARSRRKALSHKGRGVETRYSVTWICNLGTPRLTRRAYFVSWVLESAAGALQSPKAGVLP